MLPLKLEKDNKFLDHCWITSNFPILVALVEGNKVFIL